MLTTVAGALTTDGTTWYVDSTPLDFGSEEDLQATSPNDFDADGAVETVTEELQGLKDTEVTVDVEVVDGVGVVYNLQDLVYRSTDSSGEPTPTEPTPTQPSPTN